jgi:K(+)-stimulated pyrophosphate-energized sodium pump
MLSTTAIIFAPIAGIFALLYALYLARKIAKADPGNEKMQEISKYIHEGAMAFLKREYRTLAIFIVVVFFVLGLCINWLTAVCFVNGAIFSILAGYFGMQVATRANCRTANAAGKAQNKALEIAFSSGSVMGMSVVGLGILGIGVLYLLIKDANIVTGFGFGASSIALFARVGGGIYTKAADVGADLVGKVESGIPEDDPRNPAVIADNVGDNVGDVAGMGADLFESYVGSIISALTLGVVLYKNNEGILYPLLLASAGVIASIIGSMFVKGDEKSNPQKALKNGSYASSIIIIIAAFILSKYIFGNLGAFFAITAGLAVGILIGELSEVYTSADYKYVKNIARQSETGPATTIITGLSVGMYSTVLPMIFIAAAIVIAFYIMGGTGNSTEVLKGLYGISLAAVGMLSTTGMTVAVDAYGPVADNAGGIAEMAGLPDNVRNVTDTLDSVGNTTAAMGKGFAIGSAALTALALFASFSQAVGLKSIDLLNPMTLVGMLLGGAIPYLFASLAMSAVGKAANHMVEEVRRQFKEKKGILEGKEKPDYSRCVDISTQAALHEMVLPGILAVTVPVITGIILGTEALAGLIAGAVVTGVLVAIFMANAGGAWDNAKKYIETGKHGGKGSYAHKAAVVGDTVGDPFKDTAGPAMNILIKLMTIVSLVFAPVFVKYGGLLMKLIK